MPRWKTHNIDEAQPYTSGDVTAGSKTITYDLGGLRRIRIKQMSMYNRQQPYAILSLGVSFGTNQDLVLDSRASEPFERALFTGELEVECSALFWTIENGDLNDSIRYEAIWEEEF